jgi:K+-transporting ATPase ATPase C chain
MVASFMRELKPSCLMFLWLSLIAGVAYPLAVTALGGALFPHQAAGSLILRDGVVAGSALIGQPFAPGRYFAGRPSATAPFPNNAAASGGSNLAPTNPALAEAVKARAAGLEALAAGRPVPMDLATASASGLDPHLSPEAARWQAPAVAKARGLLEKDLADLIAQQTEGRLLGVWGEPRINVARLNLALDALADAK